jgi:hypothetical protein
VFAVLLFVQLQAPTLHAQLPVPTSQPQPPGQDPNATRPEIRVDVNLVVLHTTVLDDRGWAEAGKLSGNGR